LVQRHAEAAAKVEQGEEAPEAHLLLKRGKAKRVAPRGCLALELGCGSHKVNIFVYYTDTRGQKRLRTRIEGLHKGSDGIMVDLHVLCIVPNEPRRGAHPVEDRLTALHLGFDLLLKSKSRK
jgi:hypothetical protein